jgi:hypothetical protein
MLGQLGRGGGLAGALQAGHQDDGGRLGIEVDVGHAFAHGRRQLLVDDGHQHLAGLQRADDFLAQRLFLDAGNEVAHHGQGHVGFQQGHAHFAQHVLHIGLGDAGLAAHLFDKAREFIGECGGHKQKHSKVMDGRSRARARSTTLRAACGPSSGEAKLHEQAFYPLPLIDDAPQACP